jgi:hypothetical protein
MRFLAQLLFCKMMLIVSIIIIAPSSAHASEPWTPMPFTHFNGVKQVLVSDNGSEYALDFSERRIALPQGMIPQAVLPHEGSGWLILGRQAISGFWNAVTVSATGDVKTLTPPEHVNTQFYLLHGFNALSQPFAVIYDVVETMPSGRSGKTVRDGVDLYRLSVKDQALNFERIIDKSPLGGLDNTIRDVAETGAHVVCGHRLCWRVRSDVSKIGDVNIEVVQPASWADAVIVDVKNINGQGMALIRLDYDDRFRAPPKADETIFRLCTIEAQSVCTPLATSDIPLTWRDQKTITTVQSCEDLSRTLTHDLATQANGGLAYIGMNNFEGRIPWSQVYVLDGLLDIAEGKALKGAAFNAIREQARTRIRLELSHWDALADTVTPWFWSKRYSVERQPIVSLVHMGRMTRIAARAQKLGLLSAESSAVKALSQEVITPDKVMEREVNWRMTIRKGITFWMDGGNVPWNYQSSWIEGVASLNQTLVAETVRQSAITMTLDFIKQELEETRPKLWKYCRGGCQEGWKESDGVSTNTPNWEGNKTRTDTAHISYRTMDARAVLELRRALSLPALDWIPSYFKSLVEEGWLSPWLIASLQESGQTPTLHTGLIALSARAPLAYESPNQVWALDELAKVKGCGG